MHYSASPWHEWAQMSNSWDVILNLQDYQALLHHGSWRWVTWPYLPISEIPRRSRAVFGLHLIKGSAVWGRLKNKRRCTITRWSLAAHRGLFRMGPRYDRRARSQNRLRWLAMVWMGIRALWRPGLSATVLVDGLNGSHKCSRRISQSFDGMFPGGSPLRGWFQAVPIPYRWFLNHRIVVCGTLKRLVPPAVFKLVCSIPIALCLSLGWDPSKSLFVGIKSMSYKLRNPSLAVPIWSTA